MNAEHLMDAVGLLDDDLIREAEEYRPPRRNYGTWLGWAASFAVVLVLGYGVTHLGMGGGSSNFLSGGSAPAASAPAGSRYDTADGQFPPIQREDFTDTSDSPSAEPAEPDLPGENCPFKPEVELFGMEEGQRPAIMVDSVLCWYTSATAVFRPEGLEVRESTSYIDGIPEEDGQINFPKEGVRYVRLEGGEVALNWNGSYEWKIFAPDPPQEP